MGKIPVIDWCGNA